MNNLPAPCKTEEVWYFYRPGQWVLKGISLQVPIDGFLTILGPSGSGKTTLVKVMAGLLTPQKGSVELLGQPLSNGFRPPQDLRQKIGYIPQQLGLVRGMTALENVLLGALARIPGPLPLLGIFPKDKITQACEYLDFLGIADKANEKVFRLSGGERQRVAIARTLLQKPRIIFADEFVSDLDLPRAEAVLVAMRALCQREGVAFVINLHEIPLVHEIGDQVVILKAGSIVYRGQAKELSMGLVREVIG